MNETNKTFMINISHPYSDMIRDGFKKIIFTNSIKDLQINDKLLIYENSFENSIYVNTGHIIGEANIKLIYPMELYYLNDTSNISLIEHIYNKYQSIFIDFKNYMIHNNLMSDIYFYLYKETNELNINFNIILLQFLYNWHLQHNINFDSPFAKECYSYNVQSDKDLFDWNMYQQVIGFYSGQLFAIVLSNITLYDYSDSKVYVENYLTPDGNKINRYNFNVKGVNNLIHVIYNKKD